MEKIVKTVFEINYSDKSMYVISDEVRMSFLQFKEFCKGHVDSWVDTYVTTTEGEMYTVKEFLLTQ